MTRFDTFRVSSSLLAAWFVLACSSPAPEQPAPAQVAVRAPAVPSTAPQQVAAAQPPSTPLEPLPAMAGEETALGEIEQKADAEAGKSAGKKTAAASPRTSLAGCLAQPEDERGAAKRSPGKKALADGFGGLTVTADADGIVVVHGFRHNCCLSANVTTKVKGTSVRVVEALAGDKVCKCLCSSTIRTVVPLEKAGTYDVEVERTERGELRETLKRTVEFGG